MPVFALSLVVVPTIPFPAPKLNVVGMLILPVVSQVNALDIVTAVPAVPDPAYCNAPPVLSICIQDTVLVVL